jgi:hypothetical protein
MAMPQLHHIKIKSMLLRDWVDPYQCDHQPIMTFFPSKQNEKIGGQVKSLAIHAVLLAGLVAFIGTVASTVPAAAKCMIDEGNGRYTPCEALYMSKKCMIDEGNGRYTPCEALVKQMKTKKKKG